MTGEWSGGRRLVATGRRWGKVRRALVSWGVFGMLTVPFRARGDVELWSSFEVRVPVHESEGFPGKTALRIVSEPRWRRRSDGLGQFLLRVGVRLDVADWLSVVVQPALYTERDEGGEFLQGIRAELEPTFSLELGDFELSDRHRLAYRWETDEITWYYRNMLRVEYAPDGLRLVPFIWGEGFLEVMSLDIDEYRFMGGVQVKTSESTHLDVGYVHRAREEDSGWVHDQIGAVYLVFDGWE